jgi:hypothetical protein
LMLRIKGFRKFSLISPKSTFLAIFHSLGEYF